MVDKRFFFLNYLCIYFILAALAFIVLRILRWGAGTSLAVVCGLNCLCHVGSLFPDQETNLCPLHWKGILNWLDHQENPQELFSESGPWKSLGAESGRSHGQQSGHLAVRFYPTLSLWAVWKVTYLQSGVLNVLVTFRQKPNGTVMLNLIKWLHCYYLSLERTMISLDKRSILSNNSTLQNKRW